MKTKTKNIKIKDLLADYCTKGSYSGMDDLKVYPWGQAILLGFEKDDSRKFRVKVRSGVRECYFMNDGYRKLSEEQKFLLFKILEGNINKPVGNILEEELK